MEDCLFCKIAAGEIPSDCLYQDESVFAFKDIAPQAPVHFLVIPREHIDSAAAVGKENSAVVAHIFEIIAKLAREQGLRASAWSPTWERARGRRSGICISMSSPAGT